MPKLVQCSFCNDVALGIPTVHHPDGEPMFIGRAPAKPIVVKCRRCKRSSKITPQQFVRMKDVSPSDLESMGFPKEVLY